MVTLYDNNFREEDIDKVKFGDVIIYPSNVIGNNYLIVKGVNNGNITGQLASPNGVNSVSASDIVSACNL
jgi:hypothetical protein